MIHSSQYARVWTLLIGTNYLSLPTFLAFAQAEIPSHGPNITRAYVNHHRVAQLTFPVFGSKPMTRIIVPPCAALLQAVLRMTSVGTHQDTHKKYDTRADHEYSSLVRSSCVLHTSHFTLHTGLIVRRVAFSRLLGIRFGVPGRV